MRIFLDANILFSASLPQSRMRTLLETAFRYVICLTSAYAIEEARRNFEVKSPENISRFETLIARCELITVTIGEFAIELPPKDLPILRGAVGGKATHLLTGDEKHFGAIFGKTVQNVKIVSPQMLAAEFAERGWL